LIVSDPFITVLVDGSGNCIEIEDGLVAIGSGGLYAQSAATAMMDNDLLQAEDVATKAMKIAADLCVYTNHTTCMEILETPSAKLEVCRPGIGLKRLVNFIECSYTET
jgi:ATP-dependent HslUV protease subunit HslV